MAAVVLFGKLVLGHCVVGVKCRQHNMRASVRIVFLFILSTNIDPFFGIIEQRTCLKYVLCFRKFNVDVQSWCIEFRRGFRLRGFGKMLKN